MPDIVRMLADDALGTQREECAAPLAVSYYAAFEAIDTDPNNELVVGGLDGNKQRRDAIRFYESLGFVASHEGMKLDLSSRRS